jgi:pimeloyl-ACP methyl ester carboxylesterase
MQETTKPAPPPPLICLHGGPGATSAYMRPFSLLAVDYGVPVILYDQLGCGKSSLLREKKGDKAFWTVDLFVAELRNLIDVLMPLHDDGEIGVTAFDLLGHSWGGQVAARFAAREGRLRVDEGKADAEVGLDHEVEAEGHGGRRPQHTASKSRLRKLIIAQSTAVVSERQPYFVQQMANLPPPHAEVAHAALQEGGRTDTPAYQAAMDAYMERHMCRVKPWPREMLECMAALQDNDTVSSTMEGPLQDFDLQPDLRELTAEAVPGGMLVMNGRYDQSVDEVVRPFLLLPGAKVKWVRFAESSHMAMLEETELVMAEVGKFLMHE